MVLLSAGAAPDEGAGLRALPAGIDLQALKPHLVNLSDGRFSSGGQLRTTAEDIDAIFSTYLPAFVAGHGGADVPLLFWAHGGLVNETAGITGAARQIPWWLANGVYPIFFIWETGLLDAFGALLGGGQREAAPAPGAMAERGFFADAWNKTFELLARPLGPKVWGQMKISAAQSVADDGGARYVARALADYVGRNPQALKLHAAGHSAGSIFHSYFLPAYAQMGAGAEFSTLNLLAPAITTAGFKERLQPLLGTANGIGHLGMFSMSRELEEEDTVPGGYTRSLLCLIRASLEVQPNTPILGLQESVLADASLSAMFAGTQADAVWSVTTDGPMSSRSAATSHGAFDNDPDTMNSVLVRVLEREDVIAFRAAPLVPGPAGAQAEVPAPEPAAAQVPAAPTPATTAPARVRPAADGERYALCVGINKFANLPQGSWLNGCVNDAEDFAAVLQSGFGFAADQIEVLTDAAATKAAVMGRLGEAMDRAAAGGLKHVVFTFSSHGTQVPDTSGDEADQVDEAFATYDLNQAGDQWDPATLIIDDELHDLLARAGSGVLVEVVLDTCHSGTGLKALDLLPGRRPRFLPPPTPIGLELTQSADPRAFRDLVSRSGSAGKGAGRPVLLAGCRSDQTSADANFAGRYSGAFTYYLLQELTADPSRTRRALLGAVSKSLTKARFDQRAQLEGPTAAKATPWGTAFAKTQG